MIDIVLIEVVVVSEAVYALNLPSAIHTEEASSVIPITHGTALGIGCHTPFTTSHD